MPGLKIDIKYKIAGFELDVAFDTTNSITGVFGPSGAGKSTLFNALNGVVKPDGGSIELNGNTIFSSTKKINLPLHKRKIGVVFQDFKLFPHLTAKENLLFAKKAKEGHLFYKVVEMLNIKKLLGRKPVQLSGGEKQRIAIGRAILSQPDILLLDEPFSALDAKIKNEIIDFIKQIPVQFNIPILIISHELSDILQLSSEIILIKDGRILNKGSIYDLFTHKPSIKLLSYSGLKNILELKVGHIDKEKETICLSSTKSQGRIKVISNDMLANLKPGDNVKFFLAPEDVAISLQAINNVSIQNQIKGRVEDIFYINGKMICMVDAGIKIMAEIARASVDLLGLEKGKEVWCLFKSVAPRVI